MREIIERIRRILEVRRWKNQKENQKATDNDIRLYFISEMIFAALGLLISHWFFGSEIISFITGFSFWILEHRIKVVYKIIKGVEGIE